MRFRAYIAASVDGYVATPDGGVEWLEAFDGESYGYEDFTSDISTIVVGRTTLDQVLSFGDWPYPGKEVLVLTSRPLEVAPAQTRAWRAGPESLVAHLRGTVREGDVWILGGPQTIRAFSELGAVESYEIFVMPVLLGDGIPLFAPEGARQPLRLTGHQVFSNGAVQLAYEPSR